MHIAICRFSIPLVELLNRYEKGSKLSGVIYIHRISDDRFGGITGRNFDMFRKLCGDTALKNVVIVTNMWDEVSRDIGEAHEKVLSNKIFKPVLSKGAQMVRHHDTTESVHDIIRKILRNPPVVLQIQRELVDERKDLVNTTAAKAINRELNERVKQHQAELKEGREGKDEEMRRNPREQMKTEEDSKRVILNCVAEKEKEGMMKRERNEARRNRQLIDPNRRLQDTANASAADRVRRDQGVKKQQDRLGSSGEDRPDRHQASPSRPLSLQMPSRLTPCVQVHFYLITQDRRHSRIIELRRSRLVHG